VRMRAAAAGIGVALALLAAACGQPRSSVQGSGGRPALAGSLTVFAAASLTTPFTDVKTGLADGNPGFSLIYSFAGSQQLVAQITAGAPADVVATADQETMARLVTAGLVETPTDFARNSLQIAVASRNPKAISQLADLARPGLKVVLADPSVPAGRYTEQALERAAVTVRPVSLELNVKSVIGKVISGEADAAVVYTTDVTAAGKAVAGVDIPAVHNVVASYPVAVVKAPHNRRAAQAFVDELLHGQGRDALVANGFMGV
jgi:molybdate transport system substrate-binding protein